MSTKSRLLTILLLTLMSIVLVSCSSAGEKISANDYVARFSTEAHLLIDVRTPQEYAEGHIAGSVNIPVQVLEGALSQLPMDVPIVVYCRSGNRSGQAAQILAKNKFTSVYDLGAISAWTQAGYPLEYGSN